MVQALPAILAGTATIDGTGGADYYMKQYGHLPSNYISKAVAQKLGWDSKKGNLRNVMPNSIMGGDKFSNRKGLLPASSGRVWFEADINYTGGYRNTQRLVYSNDGLVFVTYDHYKTFYEVN